MSTQQKIHLNAFVMATPTHHQSGLWKRPSLEQWDPNRLDTWVRLGETLERGGFTAIFLADHLGAPERHNGSFADYIARGEVFPTNDPLPIVSALAATTSDLGLVFTSSTVQHQPFVFARQASTLDHLSGGRAGWNLVTTALRNSYRNLSYQDLVDHEERYRLAREYVDVLYKLWEGSWDDDAVVLDAERGIYADPSKVHEIAHVSERFSVEGPFLVQPSPQVTPFLFLAGVSPAALDLAAQHAEGWTIVSTGQEQTRAQVDGVRARAVEYGRAPDDVAVFQGLKVVIGSTETEARERYEEIKALSDVSAARAAFGGIIGLDLAGYGPDDPIDLTKAQGVIGPLLARLGPDTDLSRVTLRQLQERRSRSDVTTIVGTPEQIAESIIGWIDTGIDGVNIEDYLFHGGYRDFVDHVVPILRRRGHLHDIEPGRTLRERVFGDGPRLSARHPAAAYRGAFA